MVCAIDVLSFKSPNMTSYLTYMDTISLFHTLFEIIDLSGLSLTFDSIICWHFGSIYLVEYYREDLLLDASPTQVEYEWWLIKWRSENDTSQHTIKTLFEDGQNLKTFVSFSPVSAVILLVLTRDWSETSELQWTVVNFKILFIYLSNMEANELRWQCKQMQKI